MPVSKQVELYGMMDQVEINGKKFDPERIDFTQEQGVTERRDGRNDSPIPHTRGSI